MSDVARWSDDYHLADLLAPCQKLADRQQERMSTRLETSEAQSARADEALVGLGLASSLAGLLSGYSRRGAGSQPLQQEPGDDTSDTKRRNT